ncbi:formate dehydrogenase delta subunit [Sphaerotilus hippei]|uniref:Formate dehydrogenase delta subunit n=1 Tax=Sphaerotilus hippei TaxID=744406 RepID=A0A318GWG7_9BURK|nr:formate dehydrogenase subunit delta [Sphaerotilus hippei]PXW93685.1 formate dehydrogenase delta subunit [Sphaerotilus hippei]
MTDPDDVHHDPDLTLVRLANRIGDFFASFPDHEEAIDGVTQHLRKFWEPRMRRRLYAYLDGPAGGAGLSDLVREAVIRARGILAPADREPSLPR